MKKSFIVHPILFGIFPALFLFSHNIEQVSMDNAAYTAIAMAVSVAFALLLWLTLSFVLRHGWWVLLALVAGAAFGVRKLARHPVARIRWHRLRSRVPLLGPLASLVSVSQFVRTLGMLVSVGVPIMDALAVAGNVANNEEIVSVMEELQRATRAGRPVAESLGAYSVFPPMVVQLVASGEEAGILPEMLVKSADLLDKDIDRITTALLVKLEPALTLVMGLVVGLILMGVYLPMFDYMACLQ